MSHLLHRALAFFAAAAASSLATLAQPSLTPPTTYRLSANSSFLRGCFDPCACPISEYAPVLGTFRLERAPSDPLFDHYRVTDVNWIVPGLDARVTGSGTYRIGGEVAIQHQLVLDLQIGNEDPLHFDSGLVVGTAAFPRIAIAIAVNGFYCFDHVFEIEAAPVSPREIRPYRLLAGSTYQEGCWDPCDCILWPEQPMRGSFNLLALGSTGGFSYYAALDVRLGVLAPSVISAATIRGSGIYQVSSVVADPPRQRLRATLAVRSDPPAKFDSGLVAAVATFPRIDVLVSMNQLVCYDRAVHIVAAPLALSAIVPSP
ncbi:MAG: hypothetical protein AB7Q17_02950 [Phycisphaerae bacterium]